MSRPYSAIELQDIRNELFKKYRLSNIFAFHEKCNHKYLVKKNSVKETKILNKENIGNCSVCWAIKDNWTDPHYDYLELILIDHINHLDKNFILNEKDFYTWLYRKK